MLLAKGCLRRAQDRQKAYADQKGRDIAYKVGDELLLNINTKNLHESSTLKSLGTPQRLFIQCLNSHIFLFYFLSQKYLPFIMNLIHFVSHVSLATTTASKLDSDLQVAC